MLQKIHVRSYVTGLIAMFVLGTGYLVFAQGNTSSQNASASVTAVRRGTISSSIKAAGKVTFASEQELRFNQKGTVAKVNVKAGDRVTQGQVIAELDKSSVNADIQAAALTLNASALQLQQLQSQKTQTITDAQNTAQEAQRQLRQAQDDLAIAQQKAPTDLESAQRAVQEKQAAFAQAQLDLEKQKATEIQSLASTAQDTLVTAEQLLDSFYSILTNDVSAHPPSGDYSLDIYHLLYNDPSLATQVENDYLNAANGTRKMRDAYGTKLATEQDPAVVLRALSDAQSVSQSIYALAEDSYAMLQGASTGTTGFTIANLSTLRSTVSSNRSQASALTSQVQTAQANLTAMSSPTDGIPSVTLKAKEDALTSAANSLRQAQDSLALLQTQTPATLKQQQDALQKMQEDLQSKNAAAGNTTTTTDINIRLKQNDVAQKATALTKAKKLIQDYQLTAPFDGMVTHLDYKVGDNLLDTGDTEYAVLQNPDFIVVTIPLDQVDVVHTRTGMKAVIAFDAVPGRQFDGTIDTIDSTPIEQSGVVSYNVSIKLPTPEGLNILSGMTATVEIQTSKKDNALVVPSLAIQQVNGQATVKTADGRSVPVTTGITDGQYIEILSGVQEGDQILSMNISVQSQSTGNNAGQLFRFGGLGGGGGGIGSGNRNSGSNTRRPD